MAKGRKPKLIPTTAWLVLIEQPVAQQVDLILLDPSKRRVRYGTRSALANYLFKKWIADLQAGKATIPQFSNDDSPEEAIDILKKKD